jgi:single-strand DNA-binding protein
MGIASCQILGNLTKEPDFRRTASGSPVCELSVAVNQHDEVSFIEIVAWGKTAENCHKYLSKGSSVFIEGELKQERWTDKHTGANRSKLRVSAKNITFVNNRNDRQEKDSAYQQDAAVEDRPVVDPQYAPEPHRPRFYGDTGGARNQTVAPAQPATPEEPIQDDIPF